ncbi:ABC transporter ATP-binding protein [Streptomyces milbemycinicus]|uniref:ABC transporter ATP-binding protein n=1 Tax=Streptomyces milbemycinicus TaxID=476552 RepID=UPI003408E29F
MVLASCLGAAASLILPAAFGAALDAAVDGRGFGGELLLLAAVLAASTLSEAVVELAQPYSAADAVGLLRRAMLGRILEAGFAGRSRFERGDLVGRITGSAVEAAGAASAFAALASSLMVSAGGVVALWLIDPRLAATFLAGVPVGALLLRRLLRQSTSLVHAYLDVQGHISARLTDALAGIRTIRSAGTAAQETVRVLKPARRLSATGRAMWQTQGEASWRSALLTPAIRTAVLIVACFSVADGRITVGQWLAASSYVTLGLGFMGQTTVLMGLARSRGGAARAAAVLDQPVPPSGSRGLPPGPGTLTLRGVTLHYTHLPVLDDVDLTVPARYSLAVVGASASGKSTLGAVAGGLIAPDAGEVLLDGVPLREVRSQALRQEISYAFERPELFGRTVADAIRAGRDIPAGDVADACRLADADFVRLLPQGLDTPLSQAPMSGGEAQRIGLARAFAAAGRLVIMDDATSSLDTVTEARIGSTLATAFSDRTRIFVAHRLSTVVRCDGVVWLENGHVRAVGHHEALWQDPEYRALFAPTGEAAQEPSKEIADVLRHVPGTLPPARGTAVPQASTAADVLVGGGGDASTTERTAHRPGDR